MAFEKQIADFIAKGKGGITIFSAGSGEIVYADDTFKKKYGEDLVGMYSDDVYSSWLGDCPDLKEDGSVEEWEYLDAFSKEYYKVYSAIIEEEEKKYQIHEFIDVTEYMDLNRDITKYMAFFKKLSKFQSAVLEKLSTTFYELLPMLVDYFKTNKAYFVIQRDGNMDIITYSKIGNLYSNDRVNLNARVEQAFTMPTGEEIPFDAFAPEIQNIFKLNGNTEDSMYQKLCGGSVDGQKYAVYLGIWPNTDTASMKEKTLLSVIQLYIENGIMQERLRYESEHDRLTGLYNKGKYMEMIGESYGNLDSIGIFNLDVNNLKKMNDTYGHEAGDKLLIKAANSIRKVTSDRVHGYRMGGDEYLMIACNMSKEEVDALKERWENELSRLNQEEDGIECVIACGMVYGEKEYDLPEMLKKADELMYEDKKAKKKPGEEIR